MKKITKITTDARGPKTPDGRLLPGGHINWTATVEENGAEITNHADLQRIDFRDVQLGGQGANWPVSQRTKYAPNMRVPNKVNGDRTVTAAMALFGDSRFTTAPGVRVAGGVVTGYQEGNAWPVRWKLDNGEVVDYSAAGLPVIEATADGDNPAFTPSKPGDVSPFPTKGDINARFDSLEAAVASGFEQLRKLFTTKG